MAGSPAAPEVQALRLPFTGKSRIFYKMEGKTMKKDMVKKVLEMEDSNKKYLKINELMLDVEYLTPLWYTLKGEADRLENLGFSFDL